VTRAVAICRPQDPARRKIAVVLAIAGLGGGEGEGGVAIKKDSIDSDRRAMNARGSAPSAGRLCGALRLLIPEFS